MSLPLPFFTLVCMLLHTTTKSVYETSLIFFSFSIFYRQRYSSTQKVKWLHRRELSFHMWEAIRATLFSLLNTDNPLLSPSISRCCWVTQPTAGSHNSTLFSGNEKGFCRCFRTGSWVRWVLTTFYFNVSIRANWCTELQVIHVEGQIKTLPRCFW